jgi:hypothetical protein
MREAGREDIRSMDAHVKEGYIMIEPHATHHLESFPRIRHCAFADLIR